MVVSRRGNVFKTSMKFWRVFITNQPVVALNWIKNFVITEQRINRLQSQFPTSTVEKIEDLLGGESGAFQIICRKVCRGLREISVTVRLYLFISKITLEKLLPTDKVITQKEICRNNLLFKKNKSAPIVFVFKT